MYTCVCVCACVYVCMNERMYEESLSGMGSSQYIGKLVLWSIGMRKLRVCRREGLWEGKKLGFKYSILPSLVR